MARSASRRGPCFDPSAWDVTFPVAFAAAPTCFADTADFRTWGECFETDAATSRVSVLSWETGMPAATTTLCAVGTWTDPNGDSA